MEHLDAIRRRLDSTSPGTWARHGADVHIDGTTEPLFAGRDGDGQTRKQADSDAEFVAHARNDMQVLLDLLDGTSGEPGRHTASD